MLQPTGNLIEYTIDYSRGETIFARSDKAKADSLAAFER